MFLFSLIISSGVFFRLKKILFLFWLIFTFYIVDGDIIKVSFQINYKSIKKMNFCLIRFER